MSRSQTQHMLAAGFDDPVLRAQEAFRVAMQALATPGTLIPYQSELLPPLPFNANAAALGLAMLDFETRFYLSPALAQKTDIADFMGFHTGAKQVFEPKDADFAFLDLRVDALILNAFAQGSPEYPDRSTTLVLSCASLVADGTYLLSGPGIVSQTILPVAPLPTDFEAQWAQNRAAFPLGVDVLFVGQEGVIGLPRSIRLKAEA